MGYVPEWARGSQAKTSTKAEHGIKKVELFHNATPHNSPSVRKFNDGGEVNIRGEKVGEYSGDDEIVKYRMNMTDENGRSLMKKDNEIGGGGYGDGYEPESGAMPSTPSTSSSALVSEPAGSAPDTGSKNKSNLVSEPSSPAAAPSRVSAPKERTIKPGPSADDRLNMKYGRADSKLVSEPAGSAPDTGKTNKSDLVSEPKSAKTSKDQLAQLKQALRGESQRTRAARRNA